MHARVIFTHPPPPPSTFLRTSDIFASCCISRTPEQICTRECNNGILVQYGALHSVRHYWLCARYAQRAMKINNLSRVKPLFQLGEEFEELSLIYRPAGENNLNGVLKQAKSVPLQSRLDEKNRLFIRSKFVQAVRVKYAVISIITIRYSFPPDSKLITDDATFIRESEFNVRGYN